MSSYISLSHLSPQEEVKSFTKTAQTRQRISECISCFASFSYLACCPFIASCSCCYPKDCFCKCEEGCFPLHSKRDFIYLSLTPYPCFTCLFSCIADKNLRMRRLTGYLYSPERQDMIDMCAQNGSLQNNMHYKYAKTYQDLDVELLPGTTQTFHEDTFSCLHAWKRSVKRSYSA